MANVRIQEMMQMSMQAVRRGAVLALFLAAAFPLQAQRRPPLEFTQQGVLVANFWVAGKQFPSLVRSDLRFGRKVADDVRDQLGKLVNKRETRIVPGFEIRESMVLSSYSADTVLTLPELRQQAEFFRGDEIVFGKATRLPNGGVRLEADLVLWRDLRLRQPIPAVTSNDVDRAISDLAAKIHESRSQLRYQRRCENALRDGQGTQAVRAAREGIAGYPRGALARTCLVWALRAIGAPAGDILAESKAILDIDPEAPHALEAAAIALDTLKRRPEAAAMWLRLAATDSMNTEFIERIVWSMAESGNSRAAEPLILRVSEAYPDNMRLMRQRWRVTYDNRNWPQALTAGEKLLAADAEAVRDSVFFLRLATAYRANQQTYKAVETVARGVAAFPADARLYALYTQFVKEEADTVLPRGLVLHPGSAELLALNAKELRSKGRVAEALDASKKAVELDSTIAQGRMMVAQAEIELGRPDSALATLQRAAGAGEDVNAVATFALSKGNAFFRAANGTKTRADFQLAMRYLWFADSLKSTPQTKFLLGASALSVAQTALTDAPNSKVKEESCTLAQLGAQTLPIARAGLEAGQEISPEATKQYLEYLDLISPYAEKQIAAFCVPAEAAARK
jgi:tetratricopeptide (TPR) repeat protein